VGTVGETDDEATHFSTDGSTVDGCTDNTNTDTVSDFSADAAGICGAGSKLHTSVDTMCRFDDHARTIQSRPL
jgi:hypothetical protein